MDALTSPTSTRDRFDLDRLADELAEREAGPSTTAALDPDGDALAAGASSLPVFRPLAHDDPHLSEDAFDVEAFLLARAAHGTLPDVRGELRDYHATLKEELVRLINDDYEAFISLSTDLRDEGDTLGRLKGPLGDLKGRVQVCMLRLHHWFGAFICA